MEVLLIKKLLFIVGVSLFVIVFFRQNTDETHQLKNISFFAPEVKSRKAFKNQYLLKLEIPSIGFSDFIYSKENKLNNVNYHVALLKESDVEHNLYYFAGHSGYGRYSYFNDLIYIHNGDIIVVDLFYKKLYYKVNFIYFIDKVGYMFSDSKEDTLYLITCSLSDKKKQLIIEAKLT